MDDDKDELGTDAAEVHQALGEFVVSFSQLMHSLTLTTAFYLAGGRPIRFAHAALAGREARATADGYFSLCAEMAGDSWSADDAAVIKALRKEVDSLIEARNRYLHDIWYVGWQSSNMGPSPPELERLATTKEGVRVERRSVVVGDIEQASKDATRIGRHLHSLIGCCHEAMLLRNEYMVPVKTVGSRERSPRPSISELFQVRQGRVYWRDRG